MTVSRREREEDDFASVIANQLMDDSLDALKALADGREWNRELYESIRQEAIDLVYGTQQQESGLRKGDIARIVDSASTIYFERARQFEKRVARATRQADLMHFMCQLYSESVFAVEGDQQMGYLEEDEWMRLNAALVEYDKLRAEDGEYAFAEPEQVAPVIALLREVRDETKGAMAEFERERLEERRQQRIAAHRQPEVVMETRMCSSCGKKPARVDDLCKRCAHAQGLMPHGKIGGS